MVYKRRAINRRPRRKVAKKPIKNTFAKRVMSVVTKRAEHKKFFINTTNTALTVGYGTTGVTINSYNVIPTPAQGVTESTRIGNDIRISSYKLRGIVDLNNAYNSGLNPVRGAVMVKLWLLESKDYKGTTASLQAIDTQSIFDLGATNGTFTGQMNDMFYSINTKRFTVHGMKHFKILPSLSLVNLGVNGNFTYYPPGYINNSPYSQHEFSFNLSKKTIQRKIQFDDTNTYPINHNLFLVAQCSYLDGTVLTNNVEIPAYIQFLVEATFTDV